MLKQRIVATLIMKNGIVVQSIGFEKYLPIGNLHIAVEALNDWGIDEIIIFDIEASKQSKTIDSNIIKESQEKLIKYYKQMKEAYQKDDPKTVFDDGTFTKV